ncbi:MAG TPA: proton-conducting transporter membrane subunit, partial [Nakamurella multipartita]|nr:proton-conducting transporter membrane subunit [Nakamurella multipartita]
DFTRALLIVLALASIALAASLLIAQRDYKRMLAYSSIENMGLLALGAAIGSPLAIAAVLLHILGHGLVKSGLFVAAGRILQLTGTSRIDHVRGLVAREPVLGWCFGLGILAIVAFPPFSLFASELGIARAGFAAGLGWVTAAALLLVLVCAAALIGHTSRMLLGAPAATADGAPSVPSAATPAASPGAESALVTAVPVRANRRLGADRWVLIGALAAAAVVGITLGPLDTLLAQAAAIVAGSTP